MNEQVLAAVTAGFTDITELITQIVVIGVPATIGVIVIAKGARYALRWIMGLFSKA